ncbi:MAG: hypothetical protein ACR2M3_13280 [Thermomicrobiales bacterium]
MSSPRARIPCLVCMGIALLLVGYGVGRLAPASTRTATPTDTARSRVVALTPLPITRIPGHPTIPLPNVIGLGGDAARDALIRRGFVDVEVTNYATRPPFVGTATPDRVAMVVERDTRTPLGPGMPLAPETKLALVVYAPNG